MLHISKLDLLSIKARIISMSLVLICSMLVSVSYGLYSMSRIGKGLAVIAEQDLPLSHLVSGISSKQLEQSISLERAIRHGETIAISEEAGEADQQFKESIANYKKYSGIIAKDFITATELVEKTLSNTNDKTEQDKFNQLEKMLLDLKSTHQGYESTANNIFEALQYSKLDEAASFYGEITSKTDKLKQQLEDTLAELEKYAQIETMAAKRYERNAFVMLIMISLISMIIATPFAWWVILNISWGMRKAVNVAQKIAEGDLTHSVENREKGEIGLMLDALGSMQSNLRNMISNISSATDNLDVSAQQVYSASHKSNDNIQNQQSEINQVATAMEEMSATVGEVAKNAEETASSAAASNGDAQHGNEVVSTMVSSINQIAGEVGKAAEIIQQVGEASQNVSTILDVIKGIAEQTNLLALNAAIEAARAGEQGRGFAVVADEVRVLAQRTQDSTQEIENMIIRLQTDAQNAAEAIHTGENTVQQSVEQAREAGEALQKITHAVQNISDMNTLIASASVQQASVSNEMNSNLARAHSLSDENVELIQQTFTHSEELSNMATTLKELVRQFKV